MSWYDSYNEWKMHMYTYIHKNLKNYVRLRYFSTLRVRVQK